MSVKTYGYYCTYCEKYYQTGIHKMVMCTECASGHVVLFTNESNIDDPSEWRSPTLDACVNPNS
jgi:hypothetical protein